jgi:hypothetical protein
MVAHEGHQTSPYFNPRVWYTCPYAHRPLVEFALAIPQLAIWDPHVVRSGMGKALADVLPPELLNRSTKGRPAAALLRDRRERLADMTASVSLLGQPDTWHLARRGFLDPGALATVLSAIKEGDVHTGRLLDKWLPLEVWLRTLSGSYHHLLPVQRAHAV